MNIIGASILAALIIAVWFAPQRWATLGMMAGVLYLSQGERIEVFGLSLFAVRFLEMAGFARVMLRREFSFSKLNQIDHALLLFYFYSVFVFLLRSKEGQAYQIGLAVDAILCYFTFRGLISSVKEFRWFLLAFLILLVPFTVLVSIESLTAHNPFALVGGSADIFAFRDGWPRCRGSFTYPVTMGTLGASFLPLYIGLAFAKIDRMRALAGIGLCALIVVFSNSGGSISAAAFGLAIWVLWTVRHKMTIVRLIGLGGFVFLVLFMKAPIWFLPARISDIIGGDGYHRSYLIDCAIRDLDKWWLAGMPILETKDWFPYILRSTGGADITNQYLKFGLAAGIGAVFLFIHLLVRCFQGLGKSLSASRSSADVPIETEPILWGFGALLVVHMTNWLGVSYFDQIYVVWFMQLAAISSITSVGVDRSLTEN